MTLNLIYAQAANGVIGRDGQLPWHLPEDLAHFKQTTLGCPVVMGRKTWESLPPRFRPLPGRQNIVLTRQAGWLAPGATVFSSLDDALHFLQPSTTVWVIGGAEVYAQALPLAQRVVVTEIDQAFEGDAHAPALGSGWQVHAGAWQESAQGLRYRFVDHQRHISTSD